MDRITDPSVLHGMAHMSLNPPPMPSEPFTAADVADALNAADWPEGARAAVHRYSREAPRRLFEWSDEAAAAAHGAGYHRVIHDDHCPACRP